MKKRTGLSAVLLIFVAFFGICLSAYLLSCISPAVADTVNATFCQWVRTGYGRLMNLFPFSVGECMLFALPFVLTYALLRLFRHPQGHAGRVRTLSRLLCIPLAVSSLCLSTLTCAYRTTPLSDKLGLGARTPDAAMLLSTARTLYTGIRENLPEESDFTGEQGGSVCPLSLDGISDAVCEGYAVLAREYPALGIHPSFYSRVKGVAISDLMAQAHLLGIYTCFSGESNVNTLAPGYTLPFTVAHEFAHQRGIIREDEANFVAFLVCARSSDRYVRYSGYTNLFEYVASALYRTDAQIYRELLSDTDKRLRAEIAAYSRYYRKYRDSAVGTVYEKFNDAYLKLNGTPGTVSYSLVSTLAVAYFCRDY